MEKLENLKVVANRTVYHDWGSAVFIIKGEEYILFRKTTDEELYPVADISWEVETEIPNHQIVRNDDKYKKEDSSTIYFSDFDIIEPVKTYVREWRLVETE